MTLNDELLRLCEPKTNLDSGHLTEDQFARLAGAAESEITLTQEWRHAVRCRDCYLAFRELREVLSGKLQPEPVQPLAIADRAWAIVHGEPSSNVRTSSGAREHGAQQSSSAADAQLVFQWMGNALKLRSAPSVPDGAALLFSQKANIAHFDQPRTLRSSDVSGAEVPPSFTTPVARNLSGVEVLLRLVGDPKDRSCRLELAVAAGQPELELQLLQESQGQTELCDAIPHAAGVLTMYVPRDGLYRLLLLQSGKVLGEVPFRISDASADAGPRE